MLAYLDEHAPPVCDPFCGCGSIPLETQRLGLRARGSDLNPVAVLVSKATCEIPPKFAGRPPVNPEADPHVVWRGARGLAEDVRYYGRWMRERAQERIGHLYPKAEVTAAMAEARPDLKPYAGQKLTVIAWLWARTVVASPDPMLRGAHVPLASSFVLSSKKGKEAIVVPVVENGGYRFAVKAGGIGPDELAKARTGAKVGRGANFACLLSGTPLTGDHVKAEGMAGRMDARLMAVVAEGRRGRVYLDPTEEMEAATREAEPAWRPEGSVPQRLTGGTCYAYGFTEWGDLFTPRQLTALTTFSDLVAEAREKIRRDLTGATLGTPASRRHEGKARDEISGEEATGYDPETRFCIDWFEAFGTVAGGSGDAITLAQAYDIGIEALVDAGAVATQGGTARLLRRDELPADWNPAADRHLTHWKCAQHLARVLESPDGGSEAAGQLLTAMGPDNGEAARLLAYRLYDVCERKGRAEEARVWNMLAQEWPAVEAAARRAFEEADAPSLL